MTAEGLDKTLSELMGRRPFSPFTVELVNGRRVEVDRPFSVAYRNGTAAFMNKDRATVTFDFTDIKQINDTAANIFSSQEG